MIENQRIITSHKSNTSRYEKETEKIEVLTLTFFFLLAITEKQLNFTIFDMKKLRIRKHLYFSMWIFLLFSSKLISHANSKGPIEC